MLHVARSCFSILLAHRIPHCSPGVWCIRLSDSSASCCCHDDVCDSSDSTCKVQYSTCTVQYLYSTVLVQYSTVLVQYSTCTVQYLYLSVTGVAVLVWLVCVVLKAPRVYIHCPHRVYIHCPHRVYIHCTYTVCTYTVHTECTYTVHTECTYTVHTECTYTVHTECTYTVHTECTYTVHIVLCHHSQSLSCFDEVLFILATHSLSSHTPVSPTNLWWLLSPSHWPAVLTTHTDRLHWPITHR